MRASSVWQPALGRRPLLTIGYKTPAGLRARLHQLEMSSMIPFVFVSLLINEQLLLPELCRIPDNATDQSLIAAPQRRFRSAASADLHRRIVACTIGSAYCWVAAAANTTRSRSPVSALDGCPLD